MVMNDTENVTVKHKNNHKYQFQTEILDPDEKPKWSVIIFRFEFIDSIDQDIYGVNIPEADLVKRWYYS